MDLKSIGTTLANIGLPLLGAAVGGPAGAIAAKGLLAALGLGKDASPDEVVASLGQLNGDQLAKLHEIEAGIAKAELAAAQAQVEAVNRTLQAEQTGGSFWQRNHHAFESSFVCLLVGSIYFLLPMLKIAVPAVPESAWLMLGGVLGVTAWQRGKTSQILANQ